MTYEQQLEELIRENGQLMEDLRRVRELNLPDCFIAAGYIRGDVWDRLHGYEHRSIHTDIDVIFYDQTDTSEERETALERYLISTTGNDKWSFKNQARMHIRNGNPPYLSTEDATSWWPETATAVGARLDAQDELHMIAPYGLDDLFHMIVRRSPRFNDKEYYLSRVTAKNWKDQWPKMTIMED